MSLTHRCPRVAGLRPERFAVADEDTVNEWLAMVGEAHPVSPAAGAPPCRHDLIGSLRFAPPGAQLEDWTVRRDGRLVGALRLVLPTGASVLHVDQLLVRPGARRAGLGRMLYRHALDRMAVHGRDSLAATIVEGLPGGPPRDPGPAAFAAAVGAARSEQPAGLHQWLDLSGHDPAAGLPPVPPGYRAVTWGTITPDEYAVAVSWLEQSLGMSTVEPPDEPLESCHARRFEVMRVGRGRRAYHTGVLHEASGRLVGYTSISKTTGNPRYALQGMTVVHAEHRGHGLGRVLKLRNLELARRHEPGVRWLETANDESNAAMVAVNAAMGYRPYDRWVTWTQPRDPRG